MAEDLMHYNILTQEALRGVVRRALQRVKKSGLPGDHHFYISFDTRYPGVTISERLRKDHAESMTVVLQHQFWNLAVDNGGFEVELSFNDIPERLVVPFAAIKSFFDPHAQFALQFELVERQTQKAPQSALPQARPHGAGSGRSGDRGQAGRRCRRASSRQGRESRRARPVPQEVAPLAFPSAKC